MGFTLIEALISSLIVLLIVFAMSDLFSLHKYAALKTASRTDASRFAAVILDDILRRVRPATFVADGFPSDHCPDILCYPPPAYDSSPLDPSGNYLTPEEHYVTLAEDPFATNCLKLTIQFYRPTGPRGGTLYIYNGPRVAPPPAAAPCGPVRSRTSGAEFPTENVETWWTNGKVIVRVTLRDRFNNFIQTSGQANINYYQ